MASTTRIGQRAEDRAVALLVERGYQIVERNYRCRLGEIDIVAREGGDLVFVEVRSRADEAHGRAEDTVGWRKQRRIARVAEQYLSARRPVFDSCRFDVVAITGSSARLYRDAFRIGI